MKLIVNGKEKNFDFYDKSLYNFLIEQNIKLEYVAVAINCKFVPKHEYKNIILKDNDDIEILSPMQGG